MPSLQPRVRNTESVLKALQQKKEQHCYMCCYISMLQSQYRDEQDGIAVFVLLFYFKNDTNSVLCYNQLNWVF